MDVNQRVKVLEDEVKVLKAEVKSVLLDIREQYLNNENPFANPGRAPEWNGNGNSDAAAPTVVVRESVVERTSGNGNGSKAKVTEAPTGEEELSGEASSQRQVAVVPAPTRSSSSNIHGYARQAEQARCDLLDLAVIAGLTEWVDKTIQRIGKHRTEAIVEGLHSIGRLPGGMKDFLVRFVELSPDSEPERQLKTKDYLTVLSQLEGLLGSNSSRPEMSLLTILNSDEASGWTKQ